jgi:uncharacterized protein (DUF849 family)
MVSLNMGRMNFNIAGLADRYKGWRYYWEYPYLQATENMIFRNTSREIALILQRLGEGCGTLLEYMCYDIGHLHNRDYFANRGLVTQHFIVQSVFRILRWDWARSSQRDVRETDRRSSIWPELHLACTGRQALLDAVGNAASDYWW